MITTIIVSLLAVFLILDLFVGFKMTKNLINLVKFKVDTTAENLRDPVADAHNELNKAKENRDLAVEHRKKLIVSRNLADARIKKIGKEISNFENVAKLAGEKGNVEDVRKALEKKLNSEQELADANIEFSRLDKQENEIEQKIKEFDDLINKAERDKEFLTNQIAIDQFRKQTNEVLKIDVSASASALSRLRSDADKIKAEADASDELASENVSLEAKYASKPTVSEDDVAKYLKK